MEHYYSREEEYYSQEIANSPSTKNFFATIEEILKEYQFTEGLTRQEAIKKFAKEQKEAKEKREANK